MLFNVKEGKIKLSSGEVDYITFGKGTKPLIMIQGLNTRGIKGAGLGLALMYRIFMQDFKVYLFDRRPNVTDKTTVRDMAGDLAKTVKIAFVVLRGVGGDGLLAGLLL